VPPDFVQEVADLLGAPWPELAATGDVLAQSRPFAGLPPDTVWDVFAPSNPHMPRVAVGRARSGEPVLLDGLSEEIAAKLSSMGADVPDATTAVGYVLEVAALAGRSDAYAQVVRDPDSIDWRPGSPEEEARKSALLASPELLPAAVPANGGFAVSVTLLRGEDAVRADFAVDPFGQVTVEERVLATGLPLPVVF